MAFVNSAGTARRTGAGWYKYDDQRRATPDPLVTELVRKWVDEAALWQRQISAGENHRPLPLCAGLTRVRAILEKLRARASDIDIFISGYGFPPIAAVRCGTPTHRRLKQVCDRVFEFHRSAR